MLSPLLKTQTEINVRQLFEARLCLEATTAELAAEHRTEEHLARPANWPDSLSPCPRSNRPRIVPFECTERRFPWMSIGNPAGLPVADSLRG